MTTTPSLRAPKNRHAPTSSAIFPDCLDAVLESPDGIPTATRAASGSPSMAHGAINRTPQHSVGVSEVDMSGSIGAASNYPEDSGRHPANSGLGHWRMSSRLELGPLPGAVPCARLHAKHIFREWGLAHLADDAELIVTELMTNALKAARVQHSIQPIILHLLASREYLMIQVWDALTAAPAPRPHAIDAET